MKESPRGFARDRRAVAAHSVKVASQMAGVSENQVRLWERRFGLLEPVRAENGYRLYSHEDVRLLAHLGRETARGIPIRVLAQKGRRSLLAEATTRPTPFLEPDRADAHPAPRKKSAVPSMRRGAARSPLPLSPEIIEVVTRGRASTFEAHLDALEAGMPFPDAVLAIELPILAQIGELAMKGKIAIAAEHVATDVIRRRIIAFAHGLKMLKAPRPLLLAGVEGDHHEVGLLAVLLHLTLRRIPFIYLGANLPLKDLERAAARMSASAVLLAAAAPMEDATADRLADSLERLDHKGVISAIGGYEASQRARRFRERGVTILGSIEEAAQWASGIVPDAR